jgi:hypothetical protein
VLDSSATRQASSQGCYIGYDTPPAPMGEASGGGSARRVPGVHGAPPRSVRRREPVPGPRGVQLPQARPLLGRRASPDDAERRRRRRRVLPRRARSRIFGVTSTAASRLAGDLPLVEAGCALASRNVTTSTGAAPSERRTRELGHDLLGRALLGAGPPSLGARLPGPGAGYDPAIIARGPHAHRDADIVDAIRGSLELVSRRMDRETRATAWRSSTPASRTDALERPRGARRSSCATGRCCSTSARRGGMERELTTASS